MDRKNFYLYFIGLLMVYPACNLDNVYGMRPFQRYSFTDELVNEQVDRRDSQGNPIGIDELPINILSGSYLSDGNYLNATLWLSDPILTNRHQDYFNSNLRYIMYVYDVDPLDRTNRYLIYSIEILPEEDGSWTKKIIEYEPWIEYATQTESPAFKVLKVDRDRSHTEFFQHNNTYVNIDLDLRDIGDPADIGIEFAAYIENEGNPTEDGTHIYDAPSRRYEHVLEWPESLEARSREPVTGKVLIHNLELSATGNITLQNAYFPDKYRLEFQPNTREYPLNGTISSEFVITVAPDVKDKVLPVAVNVTSTTIENVNKSWTETFKVTVLPPLPLVDSISRDFYDFLVGTFAIYWIPFGISSVFGYWLSRRIDRGRLPKEFLEQLSTKDMLAVNASVVAGVLIFLTVGGTELFGSGAVINISILTASIVYPFAISAILTLITGDPVYGMKFTIPGFVFLMVSVVLIAFVLGNPNAQNT